MKFSNSNFLKMLGMVVFTMPLALEVSASMSIKNIQIQNCNSQGDFCITVRASKANVSVVRSIYFMNEVDVEIGSPRGPVEKTIRSQGYLDFDSNQLVLQNIDKSGTLTEEVFNLTTMQKQAFTTRK